jgi:hypothetical protein
VEKMTRAPTEAAPPSPDTHAAWSKPRNPKRVHVSLGFNLSRDSVMAQENEHIQTFCCIVVFTQRVDGRLTCFRDRVGGP